MTSNICNITLHLQQIQHLFQAPELDPFTGQDHSLSGLEQILNELEPQPSSHQVHTTILLSQADFPENLSQLEQTCQTMLQKYCDRKIHQISNEMLASRQQGWTVLKIGLFFLTICLLISTFFSKLDSLPEFLQRLLSEGFLIAGWVGLWYPIELLLYDWWPYWREKQLYQQIRAMELDIKIESC